MLKQINSVQHGFIDKTRRSKKEKNKTIPYSMVSIFYNLNSTSAPQPYHNTTSVDLAQSLSALVELVGRLAVSSSCIRSERVIITTMGDTTGLSNAEVKELCQEPDTDTKV